MRAVSAVFMLLLGSTHESAQAQPEPPPFPVVFHVAVREGKPIVDEDVLATALQTANQHFGAANISFVSIGHRSLPEERAHLQTRVERRQLLALSVPRVINVFVVERIDSPDPSAPTRAAAARAGVELTGQIGGVVLRRAGATPVKHILMRASPGLTLTHELGHFFGAGHHAELDNIMSYGARRTRFDQQQLSRFRARAAFLRQRHVLSDSSRLR